MGAESQKSGFTESLKFLKKSLPHDQEIRADDAIAAQFGETHPEAKRLLWGDSRFETLPNLRRRTVLNPKQSTEESEGRGPRTHEMLVPTLGRLPNLGRRAAHFEETQRPFTGDGAAHFEETFCPVWGDSNGFAVAEFHRGFRSLSHSPNC